MEVVAAICDPDQARRYLRHIVRTTMTPDGGGLD